MTSLGLDGGIFSFYLSWDTRRIQYHEKITYLENLLLAGRVLGALQVWHWLESPQQSWETGAIKSQFTDEETEVLRGIDCHVVTPVGNACAETGTRSARLQGASGCIVLAPKYDCISCGIAQGLAHGTCAISTGFLFHVS